MYDFTQNKIELNYAGSLANQIFQFCFGLHILLKLYRPWKFGN
jgi:hypothetical protein